MHAGSERQKSAATSGQQLREASAINKSLSTLGLVIMSLIEQQRGGPRHVPFRDSKLTFLLQVHSSWSFVCQPAQHCIAGGSGHAYVHLLL